MAVAISQTANPDGVASVSNVITYTDLAIGDAAADRIICLLYGMEGSAVPNSATIDYGSGPETMTAGSLGRVNSMKAHIFYLAVPTGTTATFAVTVSATTGATANHVSVYRVVGAGLPVAEADDDASLDMDSTDPLSTGSITIPTDGGFIAVASGATDTNAKTWANATEDLDIDAGTFRYTTATRVTAGTVDITCTGTSNNENGALSWLIFNQAVGGSVGVGLTRSLKLNRLRLAA